MADATSRSITFPEGFLWGTATAAYQIEGSVAADGRGLSIWDTFSHTAGRTRNGDTGDVASDHYRRLEGDLDLLAALGAPGYRFSIAWPRIQPTGKGPANVEGIDFYRRLVSGLRDRGIAPVATLYHWDLPQSLEDAGGWVERDTAERFAEYTAMVATALGDEVELWITLNEPWCSAWAGYGEGSHAPGQRQLGRAVAATHHLLLAHGAAVGAIRAALGSPQVGITLNLTTFTPATDHPADLAAARRADGNQNRLFLDPIFNKSYPVDMLEHYQANQPGFAVLREGDLDTIGARIDFLGVNYYSPQTVASRERSQEAREAGYNVRLSEPSPVAEDLGGLAVMTPARPVTQMGWEVASEGLTALLVRLARHYSELPIYITENGAAIDDYVDTERRVHDPERISYIDEHLRAVHSAIEAGVEVRGYFLWSLLDNFEWEHGFSKRFGLVWVDYPSGERLLKDSFEWFRRVIERNGLTASGREVPTIG